MYNVELLCNIASKSKQAYIDNNTYITTCVNNSFFLLQ